MKRVATVVHAGRLSSLLDLPACDDEVAQPPHRGEAQPLQSLTVLHPGDDDVDVGGVTSRRRGRQTARVGVARRGEGQREEVRLDDAA